MRAAVLHGQEDLRVEDIPEPPLADGEVRVAVKAALTCGTDLKVYRRGYHARMIRPPAVFGHEWAGTIAEVGPGVKGWRIGDRVMGANSAPCGTCFYCARAEENLCDDLLFLNGAYAETLVVPARIVTANLLRLPPGMSYADAALSEPLACVVKGVEDLRLAAGQMVLIIGSGPIGLLFARLAQHAGCSVALAGRGKSRLATAARLGVSWPIEVPAPAELAAVVRGQLPRAPDVVIEAVGTQSTWEAALALVRKGGTINFFGGCPTGTAVALDADRLHYGSLKLMASFHHTPRTIRLAFACLESQVVTAGDFIDGECSLSRLPELFAAMAQGNRAIKTRVLIDQ